jgi:prepilin-type N-terminal cleavage/methylation domain-containing protein
MLLGKYQKGFTLLELLITITVLAIIMAFGVPNLTGFFEKQRVTGAAQSFMSDVQYARAESIKQNTDVVIQLDATQWCYALDDTPVASPCLCAGASSAANCTINGNTYVVTSDRFPDVSMTENVTTLTFDPARGTMTPAGSVAFSSGPYSVRVIMSTIGRARICATAGSSWGYDEC